MKLSKILMGAAVLAATLGLASCGDPAKAITGNKVDMDNTYVKVTTKDGVSTVKTAKATDYATYSAKTDDEKAKLDYVIQPNTTYYYRAFSKLATKHYDSIAQITLKKNATYQEGVAGFIFDMTENTTDETMSFAVVSVRLNADASGKDIVDTYISYYKDVTLTDDCFTTLSNFGDKNNAKIGTSGCLASETEILKGTGSDAYYHFASTDYTLDEDNEVTVVVKVTAEDAGAYTVKYYKSSDLTTLGKIKDDATALKSQTITAAQSGLTEKTQTTMARYANIYPAKHFTASFKFTDMEGNELPMAYIDEE